MQYLLLRSSPNSHSEVCVLEGGGGTKHSRLLRHVSFLPYTETFLLRLCKGSGLEGLGGLYPITIRSEFPHVSILRPLLEVWKADLQEVCRREGVEWIEEPSNQSPGDIVRRGVKKTLYENEELVPGITHLIQTCRDAREELKLQGTTSAMKLKINVSVGELVTGA